MQSPLWQVNMAGKQEEKVSVIHSPDFFPQTLRDDDEEEGEDDNSSSVLAATAQRRRPNG